MRQLVFSLIAAASIVASAAFTHAVRADVDPHGGMLRYPDVSATHVVFSYANDLWIVPRAGGQAVPLSSPPGPEVFPKFSPDGRTIAFVGNYDGGRDIYTISISGGVPKRITHHPAAEFISDWSEDGRIVFHMSGLAGLGRQQQIFAVGPEGGMPERLPVPYGAAGAISPDGQWLAYTPFNRDFRTWKRYQGGLASDIWLFNLSDHTSKRMTDWIGTDTLPMWHGSKVYYLSDDGEQARLNIWVYDTATDQRRQVTKFTDFDVKWPSIGPGENGEGEIVFQYGSEIRLLNLRTETSRALEVTIPGDRPTIRNQTVDASKFIRNAAISSTGQRAVIEARGDIWTAPAEHGSPRNLTATSGVFERDPAWSPDGRWIAFFSDASGAYELHITQSDGRGATRQLTDGSTTFYMNPTWSPDSKHIAYNDKAGNIWIHSLATGETKLVATDPFAFDFGSARVNWSHDSRWLTFALTENRMASAIHLYDLENDALHQVTRGMFADTAPVFDRKGDYIYFASTRSFASTYSDIDTTWIYNDSQVLIAVPLRPDVEQPWPVKSDEEAFSTDEEAEEEEDAADEAEEAGGEDEPADEPREAPQPMPDDGVSGTYSITLEIDQMPGQRISGTFFLRVAADGSASGSVSTPMGEASFNGRYDKASGALSGSINTAEGATLTLSGTIRDGHLEATATGAGAAVTIVGERTAPLAADEADESDPAKPDKPAERVEIEIDGFERRAIALPVQPGRFGRLAVNDRNQLIYARRSERNKGPENAIKLFDIASSEKTEQSVASGATDFDISGDGKKLLIIRGPALSIQNAAAGATAKPVKTDGMRATVSPREEWKQIFNDAWRLMEIYFYDPTMHGVDWEAVRRQYEPMLADAVNREDVAYVISEMISELNVGHAYYFGGDFEVEPSENVGMLGVDFEIHNGAYRIAKIHEGGAWDTDARNPLRAVGVKEGDYLLAVNGNPLSTDIDPWAPFVGRAGRVTEITVSEKPEIDDEVRHVFVEPSSSEGSLRYRSWVEQNRRYVEEQTDGRVGYVYVPNTGIQGQTELVRQLLGQRTTEALIIDERWNGGGQIPTRFIELLNRPVVNYWARRDQSDWMWPPDSHQGPKCMLINGPAGSGGDAFPYYFRQAGLGKLIGTRTWGGLVGISGTPGLVDGASITAPTFAFYELDGTWGIEGWGVDPDIEVIDDPALMVEGGDPQLDEAIRHMLEELERNPYVPPTRPAWPNRSGMGISEEDR